ncbi:pilin [Candidatus Saccharibacteria bacterium]|nr:pilin [Candidatus Saccharibacteria bacterium]
MKKIFSKIGQVITGASAVATLWAGRVMAAGNPAQEGAETAKPDGVPTELIGPDGVFTEITNTILFVVGIISIVMLIWGGLRYILSGGDSKKVTDAKNTILYAIIGLIVALLAYAIVNFVINAIGGDTASN